MLLLWIVASTLTTSIQRANGDEYKHTALAGFLLGLNVIFGPLFALVVNRCTRECPFEISETVWLTKLQGQRDGKSPSAH